MNARVTKTHDARQRYSGARFEGGSAITDADLNAALDTAEAQFQDMTKTWIAPAGTADDGWRLSGLQDLPSGGQTFVTFDVGVGSYTLDGEVLQNPRIFAIHDQPHGRAAALDPNMTLPKPSVATLNALPDAERYDAVFIDSQMATIQVEEDSELDEVAIRSAPATRLMPSNKVRVLPDVGPTCADARRDVLDAVSSLNGEVSPPSPRIRSLGRMRVSLGTPSTNDNPCAPDQASGYFGRLNHTIKVKLTAPNRFVWAYNNGANLYRVTLDDDSTVRMVTPFADSSEYPVSDQIAELCAWDATLPNGEVTAVPLGQFRRISAGFTPAQDTFALDTPIGADLRTWYDAQLADGNEPFLFLRLWEPAPQADGTPFGADIPLADTGIILNFPAQGRPGDGWSFSVRANANDIVFPKRFMEAGGQPPSEPKRSVDVIGTIHWTVEDGVVQGHLHDCRRRIRPLWQQKGCCTFTVGNGHSNFGDFDRIQDAIDALPHAGGKICLLPGDHRGGISVRDLSNITIEGCKGQTTVTAFGDQPVFTIRNSTNIWLKDFTINDDIWLGVAGAGNRNMTLSGLDTIGRGSAISILRTNALVIKDCRFLALAETRAIPVEDYSQMRPLVVVGGIGLDISGNIIRSQDEGLTLQTLGGLQVVSDSENVRIAKNVINAGVGHGITFGDLKQLKAEGLRYENYEKLALVASKMGETFEEEATWENNNRRAMFEGDQLVFGIEVSTEEDRKALDAIREAQFELEENKLGISHVALQGCIGIDPVPEQPTPGDDDPDWEIYTIAGSVTHVHVVDNEITNMGGSGISIPSWNLAARASIGENFVDHITIEQNHISNCARVAVATTMTEAELQELGFGGIALEVVHHAKISNNVIEDIGLDVRSPCVGIYLKDATAAQINDNILRSIGRIETATNLNIVGVSGGILVDDAAAEVGDFVTRFRGEEIIGLREYRKDYHARTNPDLFEGARGDALRIENNQITVNFGLSLDVRGKGSLVVTSNHLMTAASRMNSRRFRMGANVSVVNTDVPQMELMVLIIWLISKLPNQPDKWNYAQILLAMVAALIANTSRQQELGSVQFLGNKTKMENFVAADDAIAGHAIIAPMATQTANNVFKTFHLDRGAFTNTISAGLLSHQCTSNYLQTQPAAGVDSALLSMGFWNSTYLNHATQAIDTVQNVTSDLAGSGNVNL